MDGYLIAARSLIELLQSMKLNMLMLQELTKKSEPYTWFFIQWLHFCFSIKDYCPNLKSPTAGDRETITILPLCSPVRSFHAHSFCCV